MDDDDKLTSRDDEIPPQDEDDVKDGLEDDHRYYPPYKELMSGEKTDDDSGNIVPTEKPSGEDDASRVEPDFGMPVFGFPDEFPQELPPENKPPVSALAAARARLELPLDEETGWESTGNIELPAIFGELDNRSNVVHADDRTDAEERSQAKVMPFPGSPIPRMSEPEPSEMLRGFGAAGGRDVFGSQKDQPAEAVPDFDAAAHDAIATAVQSALKNVYGGQPVESNDEDPDLGRYTVAESLKQAAAADTARSNWSDRDRDWQDERQDNYYGNARDRDPEVNADAVLDYLYSSRRETRNGEPGGPHGSSRRDYGEAAEFDRDWPDDIDIDRRDPARDGLPEYAPPPYRDQRPPHDDYRGGTFARDREFSGESPRVQEWGHPPYGMLRGQYPAPVPVQDPESLVSGAPDSSHLLGAAGLGLIGGIALAGVLAVFVFNSFVEEGQPFAVSESTPKVVERLNAPAATAPRIAEDNIASTGPTVEFAPEPADLPPQQLQTVPEELSRSGPATSSDGSLAAVDASGDPGSTIPIKIKLGDSADQDATLISLKGLPPKARLSIGIDVGGGQWLLPPSRLADLTVTTPDDAKGGYNLEAQLLKDDAQTPLSAPVAFKLTLGSGLERTGATNSVSGSEAGVSLAIADQAAQLAEVSEGTTQISTDFLTQMLIRDGNKLMRDGEILSARRLYEQAAANGNPEAALAMGRSYDPSYFEKLPIKTGKPDPATAFQWYKKALDGGLVTARVKIDGLKQWLQR